MATPQQCAREPPFQRQFSTLFTRRKDFVALASASQREKPFRLNQSQPGDGVRDQRGASELSAGYRRFHPGWSGVRDLDAVAAIGAGTVLRTVRRGVVPFSRLYPQAQIPVDWRRLRDIREKKRRILCRTNLGTSCTDPSEQTIDADEPHVEMSQTSGNGSGSALPQESRTLAIEPSGSGELADRKATGPRTEQGKQRASRNATKHGVLSKVVVLKSEPRDEYENLLTGLRETLQPEGALEELLVEKLAVFAWRQRRLLQAENAEIRKNMEFVEADQ